MNRFKFRIWDIEKKKMIYKYGIEFFSDGGIACCEYDLDKKIQRTIVKFEIMQFTCFKDKKGIEIYEGDILSPGKREVRYGEYATQLEQGTGFVTFSHDAKDPWKFPFSFATRQAEGSEIIGNIYDNPNLLKEAKNE